MTAKPDTLTRICLSAGTLVVLLAGGHANAQHPPGLQGSSNVTILSHIPLGGPFSGGDVEIEQELARPFAYMSRMTDKGTDMIDLREPTRAKVIYTWRVEDAELHQGAGAMDNKYFKLRGRYYDVQSLQFGRSGPNADLGAVVFDVTSLPDASGVSEVGRIRLPETPGGVHNIFMYKHSDGRALLFATIAAQMSTPHGANIYDMEKFLAGDPVHGLVGRMPLPEPRGAPGGYHDMYVAYDPATRQDRFYGGGPEVTMKGGYYVYDITHIDEPRLITSVVGAAGQTGAHTFVATPDGRYALTASPVEESPIRVFDLKPGLDGEVTNITRPIGAWAADWKNLSHNAEIRWPYVFFSSYEDGFQVINMMDPTNPYTVGYYDTFDGPHRIQGWGAGRNSRGTNVGTVFNGGFGVDVRNADGLIVVGDMRTGFWALKLDGFDGWNGHSWGMPNVSSAQDWDNGPTGARGPARVSMGSDS